MENNFAIKQQVNDYLLHFRIALTNFERLALEEKKRRQQKLKTTKQKVYE